MSVCSGRLHRTAHQRADTFAKALPRDAFRYV